MYLDFLKISFITELGIIYFNEIVIIAMSRLIKRQTRMVNIDLKHNICV